MCEIMPCTSEACAFEVVVVVFFMPVFSASLLSRVCVSPIIMNTMLV